MHKLPTEELNTILQYLVTKPYNEVYVLIQYLQNAIPVEDTTTDTE